MTTPASAPGGGNVNQTVATSDQPVKPAVALTAKGDFGGGVTAVITAAHPMRTVAHGPGEIAGPGVALTIRLTNGTGKRVDLTGVTVNVQDATGRPAIQMLGSPSSPFHGSVASNSQASAVYVFTLPTGHRNPVTVQLSYGASAPIVQFQGSVQ